MSAAQATALSAGERAGADRYLALDAFRGFIMVMLASEAFGLGALANHPVYGKIAGWFDHVQWEGCVLWDLIQPAFMFMVGVAMPFALARRAERGATFRQNLGHVALRSVKLILLSQVLIIIGDGKLSFQLINVLPQIAFTYFFAFLIMQLRFRWQAVAAAALLLGHWGLFAAFPGPDGAFSKTDNIGAVIDRWWLGRNYSGSYVTINFISSTVTTLFGVWTGNLFRSSRTRDAKLKILAVAMAACLAGGLALAPFNPIVKRIWTASFTLYSTGWVLLMMIVFYWLVEFRGWRKAAFPLVVVGMNSIFIYSLGMVFKPWIRNALKPFFADFTWAGAFQPVAQHAAVFLVMWYACYWLYKRKIFLKV